MTARTVLFRVTCSSEDPHAPARVMGLLAARSLLPLSFTSRRLPEDRVAIELVVEESEGVQAHHLARLFERMQFVTEVALEIDGKTEPFRHVAA